MELPHRYKQLVMGSATLANTGFFAIATAEAVYDLLASGHVSPSSLEKLNAAGSGMGIAFAASALVEYEEYLAQNNNQEQK